MQIDYKIVSSTGIDNNIMRIYHLTGDAVKKIFREGIKKNCHIISISSLADNRLKVKRYHFNETIKAYV